jgi:hypothetical protein
MRTMIRPAVVGLAAVGMTLAGAVSAQACGGHHHSNTTVNVHEKKWSSAIHRSFNNNRVNYQSPGAMNFGHFIQR